MNFLLWLRRQWDRVAGVLLITGGGVALFLGYLGISNSAFFFEEMSYLISGGLGGLFLLGLGITLLITADLRDEWRKLDRIAESLERLGEDFGVQLEPDDRPTDPISQPRPQRSSSLRKELLRFRSFPGALMGFVFAAVVLGLGWNETASATEVDNAFFGVAVGVGGLGAAAVASGGVLLRARWNIRSWRDRLLVPLVIDELLVQHRRDLRPMDASVEVTSIEQRRDPLSTRTEGRATFYTAAGLNRFHRQECPALVGVDGIREISDSPDLSGLARCGICQPE